MKAKNSSGAIFSKLFPGQPSTSPISEPKSIIINIGKVEWNRNLRTEWMDDNHAINPAFIIMVEKVYLTTVKTGFRIVSIQARTNRMYT